VAQAGTLFREMAVSVEPRLLKRVRTSVTEQMAAILAAAVAGQQVLE
jgi:hypothetical protein